MKNNQQEPLFTELTPEEGAVIEGGAKFELLGIDVIKSDKQNDLYVNFNGVRMFGVKKNIKPDYYDETSNPVYFNDKGRLSIWDEDSSRWPWGDDTDDNLWNWSISDKPGTYWAETWGNGYRYRFDYRIS